MEKKNSVDISLKNIKITDSFWSEYQRLITEVVIPYQEKILDDKIPGIEKSHAFSNFRIAAGLEEGEFYGMVFQDSDVAKWLEGVSYSLAIHPDSELEERADEIITIIAKAQQEDGYLNTYFTVKEPEHRWKNLLECHELYCAGHMMEAAAAYAEVTGKKKLLEVMERMAKHIGRKFGKENGKSLGVPGHEEIEIGLLRLYQVTKKEEYLELARYFIDERGQNPNFFKEEKEKRNWVHFSMKPEDTKYNQSHAPVREQNEAVGHSVRAVYLYTAMAELAVSIGDESLYQACERLWDNIVNCKMYITGGIGSTVEGEAFTINYDLPNDTVYAETCASIGLVFFAHKMLKSCKNGRYTDVIERALYNGIISGMQLDGKKFFYVNPLEVNPGVSGVLYGHNHVLPNRPEWYACACCPPNVVRLLESLGKYAWDECDDTIYSHLLIGQKAELEKASITIESKYPWEGCIRYVICSKVKEEFTFAFHIPAWVKGARLTLNGKELSIVENEKEGYVYQKRVWKDADVIELQFPMPVRRIYANTAVRGDAGCVALLRGPLVYCFEGIDNGEELQALRIPRKAEITAEICNEGIHKGNVILKLQGSRLRTGDSLYSEVPPVKESVQLIAIPYYTWGNRGLNQMRVWMLEEN